MPKAKTINPDPSYVASILAYDHDTGIITWKVARHYGSLPPGTSASKDKIKILGENYRPNRVAWCLAYGEWPNGTVFWKNGLENDNRLDNLGLTPPAPNVLTADYLRQVLHYDPETGEFFWKINERWARYGEQAGAVDKASGYRNIGIGGKIHGAHRLAWLYVYGAWPVGQADHWDGDYDSNSIANLRDSTHSQNNANREFPTNNTGYRGVQKNWNKFAVTCNHKYLGTYATLEEAVAVRKKAEVEMQGLFAYANRPN